LLSAPLVGVSGKLSDIPIDIGQLPGNGKRWRILYRRVCVFASFMFELIDVASWIRIIICEIIDVTVSCFCCILSGDLKMYVLNSQFRDKTRNFTLKYLLFEFNNKYTF
jgi:hypothetical protein